MKINKLLLGVVILLSAFNSARCEEKDGAWQTTKSVVSKGFEKTRRPLGVAATWTVAGTAQWLWGWESPTTVIYQALGGDAAARAAFSEAGTAPSLAKAGLFLAGSVPLSLIDYYVVYELTGGFTGAGILAGSSAGFALYDAFMYGDKEGKKKHKKTIATQTSAEDLKAQRSLWRLGLKKQPKVVKGNPSSAEALMRETENQKNAALMALAAKSGTTIVNHDEETIRRRLVKDAESKGAVVIDMQGWGTGIEDRAGNTQEAYKAKLIKAISKTKIGKWTNPAGTTLNSDEPITVGDAEMIQDPENTSQWYRVLTARKKEGQEWSTNNKWYSTENDAIPYKSNPLFKGTPTKPVGKSRAIETSPASSTTSSGGASDISSPGSTPPGTEMQIVVEK